MTHPAIDTSDMDLRERSRMAQLQQQQRARKARLDTTLGKEDMLERLQPPLYEDNLTYSQVCDYFGITRSTLTALVRIHGEELGLAGFVAHSRGGTATARFSRRSVLHLAMLLRPSSSDAATRIKKHLGMPSPAPLTGRVRWMHHVNACKEVLEKSMEMAQDIQEQDPAVNWQHLSRMDRWQLQSMLVAMAAMIDLDEPGITKFLSEVGATISSPITDEDKDNKRRIAGQAWRGLAQMIPATRAEYEEKEL